MTARPVAAATSFELRCHRCSSWMGEARQPMELVGVFKEPRLRERLPEPRDSWRCKSCGWVNVFRPIVDGLPSGR